ncbi:MAG: hypothetical protein V1826_01520 [bacterium]
MDNLERRQQELQAKLAESFQRWEKFKRSRMMAPKGLSNAASVQRANKILKVQTLLKRAEQDKWLKQQKDDDAVRAADRNLRAALALLDEIDQLDQSEQADAEDETEGQGQPSDEEALQIQGDAKNTGDTIRNQLKDRVKTEAKKAAKTAVEKTVKKAAKEAVKTGLKALMRHPYFWIAVAILVALVGIIVLFVSCSANKSTSEAGGSSFVPMDQTSPEDQALAQQVQTAVASGQIKADAPEVQTDLGSNIYKLDYRVVQTLAHLSGKYPIGVKLLMANGPDYTYRQNVSKQAEGVAEDKKTIDALSAYKMGQAVGIDSIGVVSDELADQCDGVNRSDPVKVEWQAMTLEGSLRPAYEQLQTDATNLYAMAAAVSSLAQRGATADDVVGVKTKALEALTLVEGNLSKLTGVEGLGGVQGFMDPLSVQIEGLRQAFQQSEWDDPEKELETPASILSQGVFRAMQVANMDGWKGSMANSCRLWKAYEARQHIRQLAWDVTRMPIELARPQDNGFNNELVTKQIIVYSPEDDLDNMPPDRDVFPPGPDAQVMDWGTLLPAGGDGKRDVRDEQFGYIPIDNGIFSKSCTQFGYKTSGPTASALLQELAPDSSYEPACKLLYGNAVVAPQGGALGLVSYQKFVHIGF